MMAMILQKSETPGDGEEPKELTGLELKKALRDFKRRRQTYRTKVSTKDKNYTEVMILRFLVGHGYVCNSLILILHVNTVYKYNAVK